MHPEHMAQLQALVQGQQQQPVNVAGCGVNYMQGGLGGGYLGGPCGPSGYPLPYVPPPQLISPASLHQSALIPLGFRATFDDQGNVISQSGSSIGTAIGTAIQISVSDNSMFFPCLIRTFTGAGAIQIDQISGGGGITVLPGPVDAAIYNTDDCGCAIDLPCITQFAPITIQARALEVPEDTTTTATAELSGALLGYWLRNLTGCSPLSTLGMLGVGPIVPPSAYPAGPCPPTVDMGNGYGMPPGSGFPTPQ